MTSTKHVSIAAGLLATSALIAAFFFVSAAFAETNIQGGSARTTSHQDIRHGTTTSLLRPHATSTPINTACIQTALDARETALGTAFDTMQSAVKTALATRKSSLHDAWGQADRTARRAALKTAWVKWSLDSKAAQTAIKTSRKTIWDTFQTAARACKVSTSPEEGLGNDSVGQVVL